MKHALRFLVLGAALVLSGCAGLDWSKSVFQGGASLTATVQNPVTPQQQAAVEVSYQIAAKAALAYMRARRCAAGEQESVTNLCSRPEGVRAIKSVNRKAYAALVKFRGFMDRNQAISAVSAFNELTGALRDFRATAYVFGVEIKE